jgi:predicted DNA binding CopG/RHH family protein
MSKPKKSIPKFKSERAESRFWARHDSTDYVDYAKARPTAFPRLKPSTETISLRLPKSVLSHLRTLANERDVPYQTLLKIFLSERVEAEFRQKAAS